MSKYFLRSSFPYKTSTDEYTYIYNESNDSITGHKEYWLKIIFVDGKFDRIYCPQEHLFNKNLGLDEIKLVTFLNEEIKRLELTYK